MGTKNRAGKWLLALLRHGGVHTATKTDASVAGTAQLTGRLSDNTAVLQVQLEAAMAAERGQDWAAAEQSWRTLLQTEHPEGSAYIGLATALRAQDRTGEAEAILAEGVMSLPDNGPVAVDYARLATERADWPTAIGRWHVVAALVPDRPEGLSEQAFALRRLGRTSEAEIVLAELVQRFPDHADALHDLARLSEQRQDWSAAERWWRAYIGVNAKPFWAHTALANVLLQQGRLQEAEEVLHDALAHYPAQPDLLAGLARISHARQDLPEALRRWDEIIAQFPTVWTGYAGKIAVISASGQPEEADRALVAYAALVPQDTNALHDLARCAERHGDWRMAEQAWRDFLQQQRRLDWAYVALSRALMQQDRSAEADDVLSDAMVSQPGSLSLLTEAARLSDARGQHEQAAARWRMVAQLSPTAPAGAIGEANSLARLRDWAAADAVVESAMGRLPDEPLLYEAHGLNAMARNDWKLALRRLRAGQRRFPSLDMFRQRIYEVDGRLAAEGSSSAQAAEAEPDAQADQNRTLLLAFESLGGGGHGCEFGIFQRHCGAEPLGLLRWADLGQDQLSKALETEFAGVGEPEHTNIFIPTNNARAEYWTTDRRYHMAMRCFVYADDVPLEQMQHLIRRRTQFLRTKLMEDLRTGAKIFVYKNMKRNLTDAELDRLYRACRRYGDSTLFYIRYEDAQHPNGTVRLDRPGLMIGYIDHFSHTPDTDEYIGAATTSLLLLCQRAHALWMAQANLIENPARDLADVSALAG